MEKVDAADDLVDEKDVKTEVMRSRGAGGQVRHLGFQIALHVDAALFILARQQNRVCGAADTYPHRDHRFDARFTESTSGECEILSVGDTVLANAWVWVEQGLGMANPSGEAPRSETHTAGRGPTKDPAKSGQGDGPK